MSRARFRQRLARVEAAAVQPAEVAPVAPPGSPADEFGVLAGELAASFGRLVESYQEGYGLSAQEAVDRASESHPDSEEHARACPPGQVSWDDLRRLAARDPALALRRWEEVKEAAREEVRSGHRAARPLEVGESSAQGRARFLAVRAELADALRPRNALEQQLIDQLVQWQTLLWDWQEVPAGWALLAGQTPRRVKGRPRGDREMARLTDAEAMAGAMAMVERYHRLYLATLRALREQRRLGPPVVVRRAGQVNIGQQQVNVAGRA
jgi:hypothetical protein